MSRISLLVGCVLTSPVALAGHVTLNNGDLIEGEFKGITGDHVVWQSKYLGEIKLPKHAVKGIETTNKLKVRGKAAPCDWRGIEDQRAQFVCEDGDRISISFLSLKQVVPFVDHSHTNYSYGGSLRVSGNKYSGNTEQEVWEVVTDVRLRHDDIRQEVKFTYNGLSSETRNEEGVVTVTRNRRGFAEYGLDWFFLPQLFWSNDISYLQDENSNIEAEYKVSSGLGYQFWELDASAFSVQTGLQHNRTYIDNDPPEDDPDVYTSVLFDANYRYTFGSGLKLHFDNAYSRSIEDPEPGQVDRWQFKTDARAEFPIGYGISSQFGVEWRYKNHARDQDPNASRTDSIVRVGVNYAW